MMAQSSCSPQEYLTLLFFLSGLRYPHLKGILLDLAADLARPYCDSHAGWSGGAQWIRACNSRVSFLYAYHVAFLSCSHLLSSGVGIHCMWAYGRNRLSELPVPFFYCGITF